MRFVVKSVWPILLILWLSACGGGGGSDGGNSFNTPDNTITKPDASSKSASEISAISSSSSVVAIFSSSSKSATTSQSRSSSPVTANSSQSIINSTDKQAPDTPTITTVTPIAEGVYLSWGETLDNNDVTQYRIFRDKVEISRVVGSVREFYDYDIYPGKVYTYAVSAGDAAGNWSAMNSVVVITAAASNTPTSSSAISSIASSKKSSSSVTSRSSVASSSSIKSSLSSNSVSSATSKSSLLSSSSKSASVLSSSSSSLSSSASKASSSAQAIYTYTKDNISVVKTHPRTYTTETEIDKRLALCAGINANVQCKPFFKAAITDAVATAVINNQYLGVPDYLLYKTTGDINYLNRAQMAAQQMIDKAYAATTNPLSTTDMLTIDIMWESLSRDYKLKFLESIQRKSYFQYASHQVGRATTIGYHIATTIHRQVAAAFIVWDDPILKDPAVTADPAKYAQWNPEDFIYGIQYQASPAGLWTRTENYLAGDSPLNTALQGSKGGLYDHFGYDNGEEADSVMVNLVLKNGTGKDYYLNNQRDANKGYFWQAMRLPHHPKQIDLWAHSNVTTMVNAFILNYLYREPRLKFFAKELIEAPDYMYSKLDAILYYDFANEIPVESQQSLPLSIYFSGGGFVMSRSDWSNSAAMGLFVSGEHFSRRYDDINSFSIHRKSAITGIAGARIRFNPINERHHFFARLSISKNTLKVCDANETVDYTDVGFPIAAGTGKKIAVQDNFCGQIPDGDYLMASDGTSTGRKSQLNLNNLQNMGDITRYESSPGKYAYALGDGKFHYTSKVKRFERSFVHLFPSDYVIFDRVETAKPEQKTSVLIHTYDALTAKRSADKTGEGVQEWKNESDFIFNNGFDKALFQTLLPTVKTSKVRGGTTYLLKNSALSAGSSVDINYTTTTPRFLEFSGYDPIDMSTLKNVQITITGDSLAQNNDSEVITFTGDAKEKFVAYSSYAGTRTNTSLATADTSVVWPTNLWTGWLATINATTFTPVISNTDKVLTGNFVGTAHWNLSIFKYHANTVKQWKRIQSISVNKNLAGVDLAFSHFFDAENVNGDTYSFMPNTDAKIDLYRKTIYAPVDSNYGTHSLEVFDDNLSTKHNFLTTVRLGDPGSSIVESKLLQGDKFVGAIIGSQLALFGKEDFFSSGDTNVDLKGETPTSIMVMDLMPNQSYYLRKADGKIYINTIGVGDLKIASANGVVNY